ncbi:DUF4286 family protein [Rhizobacter sp. Root404]|uniref:DUF4286 family protein n=1 Tax=Rhizobacter sp. Root404 TaxID=1736528 RepID=UPI0006FD125E|nr:DUF4286 family protein [Rhizobacter sp. Root404]KQW39981.1 hypothetical protein ASC76_00515 [Rhizobacter sp. Root404]
MPLLGRTAVAMWWDIAPAHRAEFEDWHAHEHFRERLAIPGFRRGSRWASADGGDGFFVMYELESYETLTSPAYFARLNNPTPWSQKLMPHHSRMVRSQCHVLDSHGGGLAAAMLTVRLSPQPGRADALRLHLQAVLRDLPQRPGMTGAHLLQTQTPTAAATTEQKIRGADGVADWIVLVGGYDALALQGIAAGALGAAQLGAAGAEKDLVSGLYRLSSALTPADL